MAVDRVRFVFTSQYQNSGQDEQAVVKTAAAFAAKEALEAPLEYFSHFYDARSVILMFSNCIGTSYTILR